MLKVLFFARVREQLGCASVDVAWPETGLDLDALQAQLCREHGDEWREVLAQENMVRAVNQVVVAENRILCDGDEVAFFPPVTGG
ncbi:Molybdopterin synthase sulfur carrier subunit [Halioglobus japonicus]|nr:Molybdopterin synthase sulfur carrier subunit [Halioglobus japonicus]